MKLARRLNDNKTLVSETLHRQNDCGKPQSSSKWKTHRLSAVILHLQFNSATQFRRQHQTRAVLLFTIKITEMFELHASMPPMRSAEYQVTIPPNFLIIIHYYVNIWTINQSKSLPGFQVVVMSLDGINDWSIQTLLREENDSKQSDEIQANNRRFCYLMIC